jgi:hypothetical protein
MIQVCISWDDAFHDTFKTEVFGVRFRIDTQVGKVMRSIRFTLSAPKIQLLAKMKSDEEEHLRYKYNQADQFFTSPLAVDGSFHVTIPLRFNQCHQ